MPQKLKRGHRPRLHYFVLVLNLVIVAGLFVAGVGLLWVNSKVSTRLVVTLDNAPQQQPEQQLGSDNTDWDLDTTGLNAKNFLLTGSDNGSCADPTSQTAGGIGDRTNLGERSDTIMIIRIDPNINGAAILSFPRDLWVDIAGTTRQNRINSAFQSTDPNRLVATIEENFHIQINHYININFCAFKEIVTAVGGVKVPFLYPTRDKKTGLNVTAPGCVTFDGDTALAYVRSRSGYRYFDTTAQEWRQDPTGDLGRISRQQDFLRRSMQRALDKGSSSLSVANNLLTAALKNVITDDQLTPRAMLTLAQAMRDLNTNTVATYTIESTQKRIGEMSVLIPTLKSETMQHILAIFQGKAPLDFQQTAANSNSSDKIQMTSLRIGVKTSPTTIAPHQPAPTQQTIGVVPPDDQSCK